MKKMLFLLLAVLAAVPAFSQKIFEDDKVMIDKIEDGSYKISYLDAPNYAAIYVIEGQQRALVIDTGDKKDVDVAALIRKCTDKPYVMALTHTHGDHTGAIDQFAELYVNAKENQRQLQNSYKGQVHFIEDGYQFDLGGRTVQAFEITGHTNGGMIFADEATGNCYVGDCFGTGQVWLQISPSDNPISDYLAQVKKMLTLMEKHHIVHIYTGHYGQEDCIYGINYIQDMATQAQNMLDGHYQSVHHNRSAETSPTQMTQLRRAVIVFNPEKVR